MVESALLKRLEKGLKKASCQMTNPWLSSTKGKQTTLCIPKPPPTFIPLPYTRLGQTFINKNTNNNNNKVILKIAYALQARDQKATFAISQIESSVINDKYWL